MARHHSKEERKGEGKRKETISRDSLCARGGKALHGLSMVHGDKVIAAGSAKQRRDEGSGGAKAEEQ